MTRPMSRDEMARMTTWTWGTTMRQIVGKLGVA